MAIYTVHGPAGYGADVRVKPDDVVFVRDGFHFWAFLLPPLWMLWHRLWLAFVAYVVLVFAATAGLRAIGAGASIRWLVMLVIAVLVGLEASSLRRAKLSRGRWRQLDVVAADDRDAAERRFFSHKTPASRNAPPLPPSSLAQPRGIIGLFPEAGASR